MKTYCKNIDIGNINYLYHTLMDYTLSRKKKKQKLETARLLSEHSNDSEESLLQSIQAKDDKALANAVMCLAAYVQEQIANRSVSIPPIKYRQIVDGSSGKVRQLGIQSPIHKVYDYIATKALMPLFNAFIGSTQFASIPKRGQVKGKQKLEKWMRKTKVPSRYAAQGDIRKCYQSIPLDKLRTILKKYVKNDVLLYLVNVLLDIFVKGLSIGSYLSQWLCNFYLSFAWHYAKEQLYKLRKKKDGSKTRIPLVSEVLFYMDDFILIGTRKADVRKAMKALVKFIQDYLGLEVKKNWKLFTLDYIKNGIHHGQPINMMGYIIYRYYTVIRPKIFIRARRSFQKAKEEIRILGTVLLKTARAVCSRYGWFKNSNSKHFIMAHNINSILQKSKGVVRNESLRIRHTAEHCAALAAA